MKDKPDSFKEAEAAATTVTSLVRGEEHLKFRRRWQFDLAKQEIQKLGLPTTRKQKPKKQSPQQTLRNQPKPQPGTSKPRDRVFKTANCQLGQNRGGKKPPPKGNNGNYKRYGR